MMGIFKNEKNIKNMMTNKICRTYSAQLSFQSSLLLSVVVKDDPEYHSYNTLLLHKVLLFHHAFCLMKRVHTKYILQKTIFFIPILN